VLLWQLRRITIDHRYATEVATAQAEHLAARYELLGRRAGLQQSRQVHSRRGDDLLEVVEN